MPINSIIGDISIGGALLSNSGIIIEVSETWKTMADRRKTGAGLYGVGENYLKYCVFPDIHSIEILRGLTNLLDRKIDFFSTLYRSDRLGEADWFLLVAFPAGPQQAQTAVIHIEISTILLGKTNLSATMVSIGSAAMNQIEEILSKSVRRSVAEAISITLLPHTDRAHETRTADRKMLDDLSKSQIQILGYLANGLSNSEIAKARAISVNTVKAQVASVTRKLKFSNRTKTALFAARNGIGSK